MIIERPSDSRGRGPAQVDWLDSRHSFSFGDFYDPQWMGFGVLRVLNEDRVAPGAGFPTHHHGNMEILSYVLSGALAHRDSSGAESVVPAGGVQWMSAGHGVDHSEFNHSATDPVHFLQIWLQPDRVNAAPAHALLEVTTGESWQLLASPDGARGSIAIRQNARMYRVGLEPGLGASHALDPKRRYWLHVASGEVVANGRDLGPGDGLGFSHESAPLQLVGAGERTVDVLLFDLPGAADW